MVIFFSETNYSWAVTDFFPTMSLYIRIWSTALLLHVLNIEEPLPSTSTPQLQETTKGVSFAEGFSVSPAQNVTVGDHVIMTCQTDDDDNVVWKLYQQGRRSITLSASCSLLIAYRAHMRLNCSVPRKHELIIPKITVNEAGTYECLESDGLGVGKGRIQISVQPKKFYVSLSSQVVEAGERVVLSCVTGLEGFVNWYFYHSVGAQRELISTNSSIDHRFITDYQLDVNGLGDNNLVLQRANLNNTGTYECIEGMGFGPGSGKVELDVKIPVSTPQIVQAGNTAKLDLDIDSNFNTSWTPSSVEKEVDALDDVKIIVVRLYFLLGVAIASVVCMFIVLLVILYQRCRWVMLRARLNDEFQLKQNAPDPEMMAEKVQPQIGQTTPLLHGKGEPKLDTDLVAIYHVVMLDCKIYVLLAESQVIRVYDADVKLVTEITDIGSEESTFVGLASCSTNTNNCLYVCDRTGNGVHKVEPEKSDDDRLTHKSKMWPLRASPISVSVSARGDRNLIIAINGELSDAILEYDNDGKRVREINLREDVRLDQAVQVTDKYLISYSARGSEYRRSTLGLCGKDGYIQRNVDLEELCVSEPQIVLADQSNDEDGICLIILGNSSKANMVRLRNSLKYLLATPEKVIQPAHKPLNVYSISNSNGHVYMYLRNRLKPII